MFCSKCGANIPEGATFCPECGNRCEGQTGARIIKLKCKNCNGDLEVDTNGESRVHGIYPGGEGAGYAGGIMSAAMDGLRLADDVMKRYHPVY